MTPLTDSATGIQDHDRYKTGLIPTDPNKRLLAIEPLLASIPIADIPKAENRYSGVTFTMGGNDNYGTCGPTALDNNKRSTSYVATGKQLSASDAQVFGLYKTQNPNFVPNPNNPVEDNGVEMGAMLDAALAQQLPGYEDLVAFARAKNVTDEMIERLVAVFGGVLFAVNLETAQQAQTDASPPVWDYKKSAEWGGHAIANGKFTVETTATGLVVLEAPVISWKEEVGTTDGFRSQQLEEIWIPIWRWHLEHPAFLAGVDTAKMAEAFNELTGKTFPVTPTPSPGPTGPAPGPSGPTPGPSGPTPTPTHDAADTTLNTALAPWAAKRHVGQNREAATAYKRWASEKDF